MASFATAQKFVLHFGAFKDMSIDDIAGTDSGLLYLDNLFAIMEKKHAGGELWPREAFLHDCPCWRALRAHRRRRPLGSPLLKFYNFLVCCSVLWPSSILLRLSYPRIL
jgi:hypothetical protein